MNARWLYSMIAATALSFAPGCGGETPVDQPPVAAKQAQLRVVHASPDAPAVDVWVKGMTRPIFANAKYGDTTTYVTVEAGSYTIQLRPAGAAADSAPAFEVGPVTLGADAKVTAIAAGFLGSQAEADRFRVLPLVEKWGAKSTGKAHVRIVHASADAPTVAVDVGNDGSPEIASLARFADTGEAGVELPAGEALQVGLWAGTPAARVTAFTTPALPDGGELFVIATGRASHLPREADGFSLLAVAGSGTVGFVKQNPSIYVLHGSPDAPAVDLFWKTTELADNIAFGGLTAPVQVPPGEYDVDIFAHANGPARPAGNPAFTAKTGKLDPGERYLAVAAGFLAPAQGQQGFRVLALRDSLALDDKNARVRAVHASPDAPAVDIGPAQGGVMQGAPILQGVKFGDISPEDGLAVPPTSLTLGFAPAGQQKAAASFNVTTKAGQRAIAVAIGALAPAMGQQGFSLALVETQAWPWNVSLVKPNK